MTTENRPNTSTLNAITHAMTNRSESYFKEGGPHDPRTVEHAALNLLEEIQDPSTQLPFASHHRISPLTPEVIFVFDELDKIGVGRPYNVDVAGPETDQTEPLDKERQRSAALHKLFADLKNLLSSGPARFIFIGGRNLHDEFLADQTSRNPLLTNIFDAEIYLPSLLIDEVPTSLFPDSSTHEARRSAQLKAKTKIDHLNDTRLIGIHDYLIRHQWRARELHRLSQQKRLRPWFTLWVEKRRPATFAQGESQIRLPASAEETYWLQVKDRTEGTPTEWSKDFYQDLVQFLAYRSMGNLKRMRSLLESFIEPLGAGIRQDLVGGRFDCEQVLLFDNSSRFRILLISEVYQILTPLLDRRSTRQEDKIVGGILYLADFFMKFHRRAFSWSNLERVDELVHIHRAPDLRHIMEEIVIEWSGRYLHRIRNGLYDYRFQSGFSRELSHLSQLSEQELAALNFTLDESQSLKAIFRARLSALNDHSSYDFMAGLGELHEFDEEYELARYYYRLAIRKIDEQLNTTVRKNDGFSATFDAIRGSLSGTSITESRITWAITRLRLMLQIGMTFERSRNLESAAAEHENAQTLARSTLAALLQRRHQAPTQVTKQLNILFQPAFALAWVSEKLRFAIDTAPASLEQELKRLRSILPFADAESFTQLRLASSPTRIQNSNFALIMAETHNKTGDLYFFKGAQTKTLPQSDKESSQSDPTRGTEGYLLKAIDHYACSLHELRRFNIYRRLSSAYKFNQYHQDTYPTLQRGQWPDYASQVAAGTLGDLADAYLARGSALRITGVQSRESTSTHTWERIDEEARKIAEWIDPASTDTKEPAILAALVIKLKNIFAADNLRNTKIEEWLGIPDIDADTKMPRLTFSENSHTERLTMSLLLSLASVNILERSGYIEAAARELTRVASTCTTLLWWNAIIQA